MLIDFTKFPETAKLWIFPSNRKFYNTEILTLTKKIETFLSCWPTNNSAIETSYLLKYERFIIIGVHETTSKLTSQMHDELSQFIQELEKEFEIILFDRINICFKQGEFVQYKEIKDFKKLIKNNGVSEKTIVFNNVISTKMEFEENWEIPLSESWLSHLLKAY